MTDWKNIGKHIGLGICTLVFTVIASFIFSIAVQQLHELWVAAGIIVAGFLMGRLWLSAVQWAEARDSHIGLFGGIAAILSSLVFLAVWRSDYTGESTLILASLLLPFIIDQKREKWKPGIIYALKWLLPGIIILIGAGFAFIPIP